MEVEEAGLTGGSAKETAGERSEEGATRADAKGRGAAWVLPKHLKRSGMVEVGLLPER